MKNYINRLIAFAAILLLNLNSALAQEFGISDPGGSVTAEIIAQDDTPHINGTYTYYLYVEGSYSDVSWSVSGGQIMEQSFDYVTIKWSDTNGNIDAYLSESDAYGNYSIVGSANLMVSNAPDPMLALNVPSGVICQGASVSLSYGQELYLSYGPNGIVARGTEHHITPYTTNSSIYKVTGKVGDYPDLKTIQFEVSNHPTNPVLQDVTISGAGNVTLSVLSPQAGHEYRWYYNETDAQPFHTGTSYSFFATQTRTLYVTSRLFSACESTTKVPVKVNVDFGSSVQHMNFLVTTTVLERNIKSTQDVDALTIGQKAVVYSYFDEFGRPIQTVAKQASPGPDRHDLVQPVSYNAFGLEERKYLPYAGGTDGKFKQGAVQAAKDFYGATGPATVEKDDRPFTELVFDNSPMYIATSQKGLGQNWIGKETGNKVRANTAADAVRRWNADGTPATTYPEANLQVREVTDEQGNKSYVFVNSLGLKVLERRQLDEPIDGVHVTFADTYYLYDDVGRLKQTVPPQVLAVMQKANNYTLTTTIINDWVYSYTYDSRGRLTEKKVPGSAAVSMVYDALDRPILVQDGNQRQASRWYFTKFDRWNRTVLEGTYVNTTTTTREGMQQLVNSTAAPLFEERTTSNLHGYTLASSFPKSTTLNDILAVNYYDSHDFDGDGQQDAAKLYVTQGLGSVEPVVNYFNRHMVTASKKRVLGQDAWLWNTLFYDKLGQVIQVRSNHLKNLSNLDESVTTIYAFSGHVERTVKNHKATATGTALKVNNTFTHDHAGRLLQVKQQHTVGTTVGSDQIVASYVYNPIGQLVDKKLHQFSGTVNFLQSVDYRYNIRGQLKSINDSRLAGTDEHALADVFGMELLYEKKEAFASGVQNEARYDGLVSAIKWQVRANAASPSAAKQMERSYSMLYDKLGRMRSAHFAGNKSGSWSTEVGVFDESFSYDANGNIRTLQRKGVKNDGSYAVLDDLEYSYKQTNEIQERGNRLLRVHDSGISNEGFSNGVSLSTDEYLYDFNGNVTTDHNKGVTVTYNILNKVEQVTHASSGRYLRYAYDASGAVVSKTEKHGSTSTLVVTDYLAGFVYTGDGTTNGRLDYFGMAEGRVVNKGTASYTAGELKYEYFITDQTGNVRVAFREEGGQAQVVQENHYYPFGMKMNSVAANSDVSDNEHLYNAGSEWEQVFGTYQTFYRHYDPALGRFQAVDPLADSFVAWSPYQYAYNSPFSFNDPTGAETITPSDIKRLHNSPNGGTWSASSGLYFFNSQLEAFNWGAMERMDSWGGGGGGATSYEEAAAQFNEMQIASGSLELASQVMLKAVSLTLGNQASIDAAWANVAEQVDAYFQRQESLDLLFNPSGGELRGQDGFGSGHWGASRGSRRKHRGIDVLTVVGQKLLSPINGKAVNFKGSTKPHKPMIDIIPSDKSLGIEKIRILYVNMPENVKPWVPYNVVAGETLIGTAANLENLGYSKGITPHIHIQLMINGVWSDPTSYFFDR